MGLPTQLPVERNFPLFPSGPSKDVWTAQVKKKALPTAFPFQPARQYMSENYKAKQFQKEMKKRERLLSTHKPLHLCPRKLRLLRRSSEEEWIKRESMSEHQ